MSGEQARVRRGVNGALDTAWRRRDKGPVRSLILATLAVAAVFRAYGNPVTAAPAPAATAAPEAEDPFLWLEDVRGARAMAFVEKENARSLGVLESDPRYAEFESGALRVLEAQDRIPEPELIGEAVFNFWQDHAHVRGLWRRATPADYAAATPHWQDVLDLDALSAAEKANWVWKGANCPPPHYRRCLISLSDGGEDATTEREFDLPSARFVDDGFVLPKGKQSADWLDDDTLIVAREWKPGELTSSGYPYVVKILVRGQALDQAREVFRGQPTDVAVNPAVLHDGDGRRAVLIVRAVDFFSCEVFLLADDGRLVRLPLPPKADVLGMIDGQGIVVTRQDWTPAAGAEPIRQGSLVSIDFDAAARGSARPEVIFTPGPRQSVEQAAVTRDRLLAAVYDNVRGALVIFQRAGGRWTRQDLLRPENASVRIAAAGIASDRAYFAVETFLAPTKLLEADAAALAAREVKTLPARFDASELTVDQHQARSSDGEQIPYFVVHRKDWKLDGSNPTLLYAYGGFQVSMLPAYSATLGKLWLERGGAYVLANIRGGGEFGPAWHEAGLKTHRQLVFDDFAAVAKDLIARKITSPRRLGIRGGSNGGLLMGVEFNQRPELWRAVLIEVPLLDMLRYEKIGAGASWEAEYGSVDNPAERAFLAHISPYQNLRAGIAYPEPFFVTATSDDRVTPVHARKMAARMEALGLPFLFFENTNGGHAASANLREVAQRSALEFVYLVRKLMD
ncbi:MAG TPA: prolyl oligopeptidase family serine peptidase [Caulobacteraceae bacterium]|nr:prolyl oligopeptidase family serine peptidase [Caulobacteraceae bacterium]